MNPGVPAVAGRPDARAGRSLALAAGIAYFAGLAALAVYVVVSPMQLLTPPPPVCSMGSCTQLALGPLLLLGIVGGVLLLLSSALSARTWWMTLAGTAVLVFDFVNFLPLTNFPTLSTIASAPVTVVVYVGLFLLALAILLGAAGGLRKLGARRRRRPAMSPSSSV